MATEKRLIDANDYRKVLEKWEEDASATHDWGVVSTMEDCIWELDAQPTVDAVEVVHGEWTIMENDYDGTTTLECSVCEMSFCFEEYDGLLPQSQTYHFCPNCGAKMDGGADNGN